MHTHMLGICSTLRNLKRDGLVGTVPVTPTSRPRVVIMS